MARIVFFGTSEFSAQILKTLKDNFEVAAVVTQPDKPVGRKQIVKQSPTAKIAAELGLKVYKPDNLKDAEAYNQIRDLNPEIFAVAAYGKIIPKSILSLAAKGALNVHASLLPKYRGASPIHAAIAGGEKETGVTIMLIDEFMDHGPILLQGKVGIGPDEQFPELEQKMLQLAKDLIVQAVRECVSGALSPVSQEHFAATSTTVISKADGKINWQETAAQIYNKHRAYVNWPGIWTTFGGKILKIKKCHWSDIAGEPGRVFHSGGKIFVGAAKGSLELLEIQQEGKTAVSIEDFMRGHKNFVGSILG